MQLLSANLDPVECRSKEMICASEAEEFIPFGRKISNAHPGNVPLQQSGPMGDNGVPLVKALGKCSIQDNIRDSWKLRQSPVRKSACDEELYIHERVVIWSRGHGSEGSTIIKSFTMDSPIQEALWCSFLLPVDEPSASNLPPDKEVIPAQLQHAICVLEANSVSIFSSDGKDYLTALPFQVSKTWPIKNGLLFERLQVQSTQDVSETPKRDRASLPTLFTMMHPLDEVAPVICKTGGTAGPSKISFVAETSQQILFTSEEPSLIVTYDKLLSVHSVWSLRGAKPEEAYVACGTAAKETQPSHGLADFGRSHTGHTPGVSHSASGLSRFTLSSQSPSLGASPVHKPSSLISSPGGLLSRANSPSLSRLALSNRSQSPGSLAAMMDSLHRIQSPSPQPRLSHSPVARDMSVCDASVMDAFDPLTPEICLDHVWTEGPGLPKDGPIGKAAKVFFTTDMCGQRYLCYLVNYRHHLRCVKFNESNDRTQLIFGSTSLLQARDAISLKSLDMMLLLDMHGQLVLYSGTTKINQVHVMGVPAPLNMPNFATQLKLSPRPSTPFGSPTRLSLGPVTSSRPPSAMEARFDDDVRLLSPVPTELNDSSPALEASFQDQDELSFHNAASHSLISGIRDVVDRKFTVELTDGRLYRTSLPVITESPVIKMCLEAVKQVLPKDMALQVLIRWYSTHNAPGSVNGQSEWLQFIQCLLKLMGYDTENFPLLCQPSKGEPALDSAKKVKPSDQGADKDWEYLFTCNHHKLTHGILGQLLGLQEADSEGSVSSTGSAQLDSSALLFSHLAVLLFAFHLVYEELKLETLHREEVRQLGSLLWHIARDLHCELYIDHYCRDNAELYTKPQGDSLIPQKDLEKVQNPTFFTQKPPSVYQWLCDYITHRKCTPMPYLPGVSTSTVQVIALYVIIFTEESFKAITWSNYLRKVAAVGRRSPDIEETLSEFGSLSHLANNPCERVVLCMAQLDTSLRNYLVQGVSLAVKEAIFHCRNSPPGNWPEKAYTLIGREDLAKQVQNAPPVACNSKDTMSAGGKGLKEEEDGMEYLDKDLLKLIFSEDLRVQEVRRLLQSSRPVRIAIQQRPEVSDHDFIEEQERHLFATCIRTMALPIGRGMFSLSSYHPVPTEILPIPKLCLTGRAPPRNTTVDLTHIETPQNMGHWPQFHNGVAAGLRIANRSQLDSAWILYNRPKSNELTNEHAGFLMGLGLNGHLASLATLNVHDYLIRGHEMTSVGLLLGISAGKRGTMDAATTKLLSIHLPAFLPPTSTELDVAHNVQVAAVLGLGLVYQSTAHRHVAEVLLQEIGRPPGPEMENCTDRESYSLASGLALGLVMLGKGSGETGLSDLSMADQLYHYIVGGHRRPLTGTYRERYRSPSYQIQEGDSVNVDVTSPGATLALGMMFFRTGNSAVAEWLKAPDTQFLLDFVRPDFLMLRVLSRGLVLWDSIVPSEAWIEGNIPEIVLKYAFSRNRYMNDPDCDIDFETMSQAYCNVYAGACLALAMKFAGSGNKAAFDSLYAVTKKVIRLMSAPQLAEQAGKTTVESCLCVLVMSLAVVMAGTGSLEVLRICRHLRSRIGQAYSYVLYGSHMAISMSIGLLFLGGCKLTLSTKPESIAAMLCAFFPKFPIHSNDNRYHLQAFRHLYVLATEPRILVPKDVTTGQLCYVPVDITYNKTKDYDKETYTSMAPVILPELTSLQEIRVKGPRYWSVCFQKDTGWEALQNVLSGSGCLYVKQQAGHLSYAADPQGYHSILAHSLTAETSVGKVIKAEDIKSFSSDSKILAFAEYFCNLNNKQSYEIIQFLSQVLQECVSHEKLEILSTYVSLYQAVINISTRCDPLDLWQLKLMGTFYENLPKALEGHAPLITPEFIVGLQNVIKGTLADWSNSSNSVLMNYFSGQPIKTQNTQLLSGFLTWYNIPHPVVLGQHSVPGQPSFPRMYKTLKPLGLSLSAIKAITEALQHGVSGAAK